MMVVTTKFSLERKLDSMFKKTGVVEPIGKPIEVKKQVEEKKKKDKKKDEK